MNLARAQDKILLLYTNEEQLENKKFKNTTYNCIKMQKHLEINLTNTCKPALGNIWQFLKEINEDLNKWRDVYGSEKTEYC